MNNVTFGGTRSTGVGFVFYETIAGGHGAGPEGDGLGGRQCHMTNTRNTPVEAIEFSLPVRVLQYELRSGSGGSGRFRGGEGIIRVYEFLEPARVTLNSERRLISPYGLEGGSPGVPGTNTLIRAGEEIPLPGKCSLKVKAGDQLRIETPGGGGWGDGREI
jgi:N-methylhydantoinase B